MTCRKRYGKTRCWAAGWLVLGPGTMPAMPISRMWRWTALRLMVISRCSNTVIQSNNAEIDDRGYIYIADRSNTGLHIVELTGEPRALVGLPPLN